MSDSVDNVGSTSNESFDGDAGYDYDKCSISAPKSKFCCQDKPDSQKCGENEGGCFADWNCKSGLMCGYECPEGFPSDFQCCYKP